MMPSQIVAAIEEGRALGVKLVHKPGEQALKDRLPADQQHVDVATLRNALARTGRRRALVALDERYPLEVAGEDARGEQPADAAAGNQRMAKGADCDSLGPPALSCALPRDRAQPSL